MAVLIQDRAAAGRDLARTLLRYRKAHDVLVLALPRGGVPVAAEIAHALHAPLDILLVRSLGAPGNAELAIGAIGSGGIRVLDDEVIRALGIGSADIAAIEARENAELERCLAAYRGDRRWHPVEGKRVILVDDGVASGATIRAGISGLRTQGPAKVVLAVPVAPFLALNALRSDADEVVCLSTPEPFNGVGAWYASFPQLTDEEVRALLLRRWAEEAEHYVG